MRVADLVGAMETIAPTRFAAPWDNVGLLVGDAEGPVSRVLLTIDCTREVLREAQAGGCEAVVSYHPPLFSAQKRFVAGSVAFEAARAGVALFSPHTALDVADGGTNDVLADALGMTERVPLRMADRPEELKLVTFVPAEHVEAVSRALFAAGAGRIGDYTSCSFRTAGTGTFLGGEGTHPVVGRGGPARARTRAAPRDGRAGGPSAGRRGRPPCRASLRGARVRPRSSGAGTGRSRLRAGGVRLRRCRARRWSSA